MQLSIVTEGHEDASHCGYCGQDDTNVSYGMYSQTLTVHAYEELIKRGWRRSGRWLYKPQAASTCCPTYSIRLDVAKFSPSKSQRCAAASIVIINVVNHQRWCQESTATSGGCPGTWRHLRGACPAAPGRCQAAQRRHTRKQRHHQRHVTPAPHHRNPSRVASCPPPLHFQRCVMHRHHDHHRLAAGKSLLPHTGQLPGGKYPAAPKPHVPQGQAATRAGTQCVLTTPWAHQVAAAARKQHPDTAVSAAALASAIAAHVPSDALPLGVRVMAATGHLNVFSGEDQDMPDTSRCAQ